MLEDVRSALSKIVEQSTVRQFLFFVSILKIVASISTSFYLYQMMLGISEINASMNVILENLLSVNSVLALLIFCFVYFFAYPIIIVFLSFLYPPTRHLIKKAIKPRIRSFIAKSKGIEIALGDLPEILDRKNQDELLKKVRESYADIYIREKNLKDSLLMLTVITFQFGLIMRPSAGKLDMPLDVVFALIVSSLLVVTYIFIPVFYQSTYQLIKEQEEKILKGKQQDTTIT